ncbi:MAG: DUF6404 family protein [Gemmatimonadaceae bacterium]
MPSQENAIALGIQEARLTDAYRERMLAITEELRVQGVRTYTSAPPMYRLAWRAGLRVRPPLYQPFAALAVGIGIGFAVVWGLVMWLLFWRAESFGLTNVLVRAVVTGTVYGVSLAFYYRWKASKLRLPPLDPAPT